MFLFFSVDVTGPSILCLVVIVVLDGTKNQDVRCEVVRQDKRRKDFPTGESASDLVRDLGQSCPLCLLWFYPHGIQITRPRIDQRSRSRIELYPREEGCINERESRFKRTDG